MEVVYQSDREIESFIQALIKHKESFLIEMTGYTTTVVWKELKYICTGEPNAHFSKKILGLNSKIKSDISKSNVHIDKLDEGKIKWFAVSNLIKKNKYHFENSEVFNLDISNCFPTILYQNQFITKATYNSLNYSIDKNTGQLIKVKKKHKLKSIGMLATQKLIYLFENGKEYGSDIIENIETRNIFFMLCSETGRIMNEIKELIGDQFIFFWFDGIYFTGKEFIKPALDIIHSNKLNCTVEHLKNFKIDSSDDVCARFQFYELNEDCKLDREFNSINGINWERKNFNIPLPYKKKSIYLNEYFEKLRAGKLKY